MECNKSHIRYMISLLVFQFMHPLWDATLCQKKWSQSFWISIHASLMGCNRSITAVMLRTTDFNSCIPYGMQPVFMQYTELWFHFNSCIPYGMQLQNIVFIFPFILYFVYIVLYYLPLYPLHNHIYQFTFLYWCESPSAFMCA
jgi:hypothetical protein